MPLSFLLRNVRLRPDPSDPPARARARRLMLRCLRPRLGTTLVLLITVVAATVLPVLAPQLTKRFVDQAVAGAAIGPLLMLAAGYLLLAVGGLAARTITGWIANSWAWTGTNRLREKITEHVLGLDLAEHGRRSPGELIERVDGDVMAIADFVVAFVMDVVVSVLLLIGVLISVFLINVWLGAVLAVYCVLVIVGALLGQRLAVPAGRRSNEAISTMLGGLEETFGGVEDIRANGAGAYLVRRFHRTAGAWIRAEGAEVRIGIMRPRRGFGGLRRRHRAAVGVGRLAARRRGGHGRHGRAVGPVHAADPGSVRAADRPASTGPGRLGQRGQDHGPAEPAAPRSPCPSMPVSPPAETPWEVRFEAVSFRVRSR